MEETLHMQLEPVRTVLKNEVNEISVCIDLNRRTGVFYTLIAITDPKVRRQAARLLADEGLFASNRDFIGSFSRGDSLCLVFLYHTESLLARQEGYLSADFPRRKQIAENLCRALAETQAPSCVGMLLLEERNLNLAADLSVYFNYFLDFSHWDPGTGEAPFLRCAARKAFETLAWEYALRYEGQLDRYPGELQAFYKKLERMGFSSLSGLLQTVRMLPDRPREPSAGLRRMAGETRRLLRFLRAHSAALFLAVLVAMTLCYAGYHLHQRLSYRRAAAQNVSYGGLQSIGDVSLGDEE